MGVVISAFALVLANTPLADGTQATSPSSDTTVHPDTPPGTILVPFGASGWRYVEGAHGIYQGFSAQGYNDSSWSLGLRPSFWFVPEIHYGDSANLSQYAGIAEAAIMAIYHL